MKIVFQHDGILPVKKYGGTERMLYWHMKQLVKIGHDVILIAKEGSDVEKDGIKLIKSNLKHPDWIQLIPDNADILHLQYNFDPNMGVPIINTIHGNGKMGESFQENTVFVSKSHAQNHNSTTYINNALDLSEYPFTPSTHDWSKFLFLGKASWKVKNLKSCIKSAINANKKLLIAGGRSFYPSLKIKNFGFVDQRKKIELINQCDALLFPVLWPEPFGLAVIEANALGIPAITTPYGALKDIVTKENGIHVQNLNELTETLSHPPQNRFDSKEIRNHIEKNYSIESYSKNFILLYEKILRGEKLNEIKPSYRLKKPAETLLPF